MMTVSLSVVASKVISSVLLLRTVNVVVAVTVPGESVVAVGRDECQFKRRVIWLFCVIYLIHPAGGSSVETVAEIVLRQLILLSVDSDLSLIDAVGITSNRRTVVARRVFGVGILGDVIIAENYVSGIAILVGNDE